LDGAVGVRFFEGPRLAGELIQGSKIRVFYPYGGTLMPDDPFNFHVRDLLKNYELFPYMYDAANVWPPKPRLNLQAGSDDIDVNLDDDGDYWLPEEITQRDETEPLSVSSK
ncbi:MAG: hypothetical protein II965_05640, partial [Pyramidobacter sp.]|nr:hypothetical protein [Pyramidobacter sp.]